MTTAVERESESTAGNEIEIIFISFSLPPSLPAPSREARVESNGCEIPWNAKTALTKVEKGAKGKKKSGEVGTLVGFFSFSLFSFRKTRYVTTRGIRTTGYSASLGCVSSAFA